MFNVFHADRHKTFECSIICVFMLADFMDKLQSKDVYINADFKVVIKDYFTKRFDKSKSGGSLSCNTKDDL